MYLFVLSILENAFNFDYNADNMKIRISCTEKLKTCLVFLTPYKINNVFFIKSKVVLTGLQDLSAQQGNHTLQNTSSASGLSFHTF